jgi:predicted unusual protein kinase regulating ubiquinone biosynthesis (AarF/ABC1/UbiB family)
LAGQVHRACLNGKEVVIKVQRPGLKELFDIDLKNLRVIAEYLQKVDPKSDGAKRDWVAIYDECASVLYQEIDYTKEAFNAEKFSENFKNMDYVKVPEILWEYTTPQVLTMEYVPGIKINRIKQLDKLGVDRKRLGRYAVESYLEQILSHGFFHADPVSCTVYFSKAML